MLIFCTRRDKTVSFFYVRDEIETSTDSEFQARPRVLVSFSTRPRRQPSFNEENYIELWLHYFFKTTHPDQAETETRLGKIEANETRLSENFSSETRQPPKCCTRPGEDRESRYF